MEHKTIVTPPGRCYFFQNAHFLSAEECIMAAMLQNKYPNPCKLSPEGHFGSKFVTVVVTGGFYVTWVEIISTG